jgi:hypothetical protein
MDITLSTHGEASLVSRGAKPHGLG